MPTAQQPIAASRSQNGFTLMEILMALAAMAILAGIAIPSFQDGIEAANAQQVRSALLTTLQRAATRATVTGTRAVICPSSNGSQCLDDPSWNDGWIAFLDTDGDREHAEDERILSLQEALPGHVALRSSTGRTRIVYQSSGSNAGSNVSFTLCDGRGPTKATALVLSNRGNLHDAAPDSARVAATCR